MTFIPMFFHLITIVWNWYQGSTLLSVEVCFFSLQQRVQKYLHVPNSGDEVLKTKFP
jgi:hypothetical protein